jgi:hypothetical protein
VNVNAAHLAMFANGRDSDDGTSLSLGISRLVPSACRLRRMGVTIYVVSNLTTRRVTRSDCHAVRLERVAARSPVPSLR